MIDKALYVLKDYSSVTSYNNFPKISQDMVRVSYCKVVIQLVNRGQQRDRLSLDMCIFKSQHQFSKQLLLVLFCKLYSAGPPSLLRQALN